VGLHHERLGHLRGGAVGGVAGLVGVRSCSSRSDEGDDPALIEQTAMAEDRC